MLKRVTDEEGESDRGEQGGRSTDGKIMPVGVEVGFSSMGILMPCMGDPLSADHRHDTQGTFSERRITRRIDASDHEENDSYPVNTISTEEPPRMVLSLMDACCYQLCTYEHQEDPEALCDESENQKENEHHQWMDEFYKRSFHVHSLIQKVGEIAQPVNQKSCQKRKTSLRIVGMFYVERLSCINEYKQEDFVVSRLCKPHSVDGFLWNAQLCPPWQ